MSAREWTLITVTHNSAEHLRECWGQASFGDAQWVVVDNASVDDSVKVAEALGATVVRSDANGGFSTGNNLALRAVTTEWVAFINPDVIITSPEDFVRLADVSRVNGDALVAPQLLNADGSEQLNARGLPYPTHKLANRGVRLPWVRPSEYARGGFADPTYIAWAMGAAIAGPATLWTQLGGWDERYFIYYEDHDVGLRAWTRGHAVVLDPAVRWIHHWQRETTKFRVDPWRHEIRSMSTFYSSYPELITRHRGASSLRMRPILEKLWTTARLPSSAR